MRNCDKFRTTPWRVYEDGGQTLRARARYGMSYIVGNLLPYFSLTCETERQVRRRWEEDSAGCNHELVTRIFPELAPLVRWHLSDQSGTPMHYEANAVYWFHMVCGIVKRDPWCKDPLANFRSTVVWGAVEGDPEEVPLHWNRRELLDVLQGRLHELRATFHRDIVAAGVEMIPTETYEASRKVDADA